MRHIVLTCVLILLAGTASATTFFVYPDGSGTQATIQDAVDASQAGDSIYLMAGVFSGPGNRDILITHDLNIEGNTQGEPAAVLALDGSGSEYHRAFRCEAATVVFEDLAIVGGWASSGGGISIEEGQVTIRHCHFSDNRAEDRGGAVEVGEEALLFLDHCTFGGNVSYDLGGACYAFGASEVEFRYCSLVANAAPEGSAVYLNSSAWCGFERSIVAFGCEGVACDGAASTVFSATSTDVYHNRGGDWTAGLAGLETGTNNSSLDPEFVDPMGDPADFRLSYRSPCGTGYPGGLIGAEMVDVTCFSPVYTIAPGGRGMFSNLAVAVADVPDGAEIVMEPGSYTGAGFRDVTWQGKDLILRGRTGDPEDCVIDIAAATTDLHRALTLVEPSDASRIEGLTFSNGAAFYGGALQIQGTSGLHIVRCSFLDNIATTGGAVFAGEWEAVIEDCLFEGNATAEIDSLVGRGGALAINLSSFAPEQPFSAQLTSCVFRGNTSVLSGGAIHINTDRDDLAAEFRFVECDFENNSAAGSGGAIILQDAIDGRGLGSAVLENCIVQDNIGSVRGGGLAAWQVRLEATECVFRRNRAQGGGGMFVTDTSVLDLLECRFDDNNAWLGDGGGLRVYDVDLFQCRDSGFNDNRAGLHGGGVSVYMSGTYLDVCNFIGNYGSDGGGGCHFENGSEAMTVSLDEVIIAENSSVFDTGAILAEGSLGGLGITLSQCTIHANGDRSMHLGIFGADSFTTFEFNHCLITENWGDRLFHSQFEPAPVVTFYCSNQYGNEWGDWTGPFGDQFGSYENMSVDPEYCDPDNGVYTLAAASPCLADNNACDTLIGARGEGCDGPAGVQDGTSAPGALRITGNYPNPFNPCTTIEFTLPRAEAVRLAVYDVAGRLVRELETGGVREAGRHEVVWDGRDGRGRALASGVYQARLSAGSVVTTRRMLMLK